MRPSISKRFFSLFKKFKLIIFLAAIIILLLFINSLNTKNNIVKKSDFVSEKLVSISELATSRYDYSNVISIKNSLSFKDYTIPFTEKSFVIKYNGFITAGLDLSAATFSIDKDILTITIPPCTILTHTVNEDEVFIFDEKTSIFNELSIDDMLSEIVAEKTKTEEKVIDEGFLDQVTVDTMKILNDIFSNCGFKEVKIKVSPKN
ncbi:MAG: DUF4230 domain-containing protein [Clostridium sp.]|uniref:DUF4230 domain-containing protein n=1 Tax=Clostridium sp. TaxID=1506 RepID=UPI00303D6A68